MGKWTLHADPTGKGRGRGAYLCRDSEAWREPSVPYRVGAALKLGKAFDGSAAAAVFHDLAERVSHAQAPCARRQPRGKEAAAAPNGDDTR